MNWRGEAEWGGHGIANGMGTASRMAWARRREWHGHGVAVPLRGRRGLTNPDGRLGWARHRGICEGMDKGSPNGMGTASPCPYEVAVGVRIRVDDWDGHGVTVNGMTWIRDRHAPIDTCPSCAYIIYIYSFQLA